MNLRFEEPETVEEYGNAQSFLMGIFGGIGCAAAIIGIICT